MVSDLCGVILILFVIRAELWASYQQHVESAAMLYFSWQLSCSFQMPDRCFMWMWHGTQLLKALCNTLRYDDISMLLLLRMLCVMNVLWMCFGYVMNVLWMCFECALNVLWMCYGCVMDVLWVCYGCVMDVLWVCYGCVMDVLWMCYGCVRYAMDVLRMYAWWMNDGDFISTV